MKMKLLTIGAAAFIGLSAVAQDTPNLVTNPGFEQWQEMKKKPDPQKTPKTVNKMVPADWHINQHRYEKDGAIKGSVTKDTKVKRSGDASVRLGNQLKTDITVVLRWDLKLKPSTTYKLQAWVKGKDVKLNKKSDPGAAIWIAAGSKKKLWTDNKGEHKFLMKEGDFDWTPMEITFTTRPTDEACILQVQLRRASGTVWYDDVSLTEVSASDTP